MRPGLIASVLVMAVAAGEGKTLYETKCAQCHGRDGVAKPPGRGSRNFNDPAYQAEASVDSIAKVTADGKGKMPPYRAKLSDEQIVARFTTDLIELYPELEGKVDPGILRRHPRVVPFWAPGGRASLATLREPIGPIHLAGDYQLDMPSLADAAASGQQAAEKVLASLRHI